LDNGSSCGRRARVRDCRSSAIIFSGCAGESGSIAIPDGVPGGDRSRSSRVGGAELVVFEERPWRTVPVVPTQRRRVPLKAPVAAARAIWVHSRCSCTIGFRKLGLQAAVGRPTVWALWVQGEGATRDVSGTGSRDGSGPVPGFAFGCPARIGAGDQAEGFGLRGRVGGAGAASLDTRSHEECGVFRG